MENDCISRQAAIEAIKTVPEGNWSNKRYASEIVNIPSADVRPVVLCKDCRYSRQPDRDSLAEGRARDDVLICSMDFVYVYPTLANAIFVSESHFCGYGEKDEGNRE